MDFDEVETNAYDVAELQRTSSILGTKKVGEEDHTRAKRIVQSSHQKLLVIHFRVDSRKRTTIVEKTLTTAVAMMIPGPLFVSPSAGGPYEAIKD